MRERKFLRSRLQPLLQRLQQHRKQRLLQRFSAMLRRKFLRPLKRPRDLLQRLQHRKLQHLLQRLQRLQHLQLQRQGTQQRFLLSDPQRAWKKQPLQPTAPKRSSSRSRRHSSRRTSSRTPSRRNSRRSNSCSRKRRSTNKQQQNFLELQSAQRTQRQSGTQRSLTPLPLTALKRRQLEA